MPGTVPSEIKNNGRPAVVAASGRSPIFVLVVTMASLAGAAWAGASADLTATDEGRGVYATHFNQEDLERQF
ncbi:MAG: hypothetical protein HY900_17165 [Deltaproteobacteria bacterium]|nr:hypothetical protein [Deltaproteobacteria bacterium]